MKQQNSIKIFEDKKVRTLWDADHEKWYFSIVDVIGILTDSKNARKYWSVLKTRLKTEGSQLTTNCSQLKMQSADGKYYLTDVADTEQLFRLIQATKIKTWDSHITFLITPTIYPISGPILSLTPQSSTIFQPVHPGLKFRYSINSQ